MKNDFLSPFRAAKSNGRWCVVDANGKSMMDCDCRLQAEEFASDINNPYVMPFERSSTGLQAEEFASDINNPYVVPFERSSTMISSFDFGVAVRSKFDAPDDEFHSLTSTKEETP